MITNNIAAITFSQKTKDRGVTARQLATQHSVTLRQARKYLQDRDLPKGSRRFQTSEEWLSWARGPAVHADNARKGGVTRRR